MIIVGFEFAPDTGDKKIGRIGVARVRMHRDLHIRDQEKDDERHPAFVIVGQPEIRIHDAPNDETSVIITTAGTAMSLVADVP